VHPLVDAMRFGRVGGLKITTYNVTTILSLLQQHGKIQKQVHDHSVISPTCWAVPLGTSQHLGEDERGHGPDCSDTSQTIKTETSDERSCREESPWERIDHQSYALEGENPRGSLLISSVGGSASFSTQNAIFSGVYQCPNCNR
jgi:hypothetical protein